MILSICSMFRCRFQRYILEICHYNLENSLSYREIVSITFWVDKTNLMIHVSLSWEIEIRVKKALDYKFFIAGIKALKYAHEVVKPSFIKTKFLSLFVLIFLIHEKLIIATSNCEQSISFINFDRCTRSFFAIYHVHLSCQRQFNSVHEIHHINYWQKCEQHYVCSVDEEALGMTL